MSRQIPSVLNHLAYHSHPVSRTVVSTEIGVHVVKQVAGHAGRDQGNVVGRPRELEEPKKGKKVRMDKSIPYQCLPPKVLGLQIRLCRGAHEESANLGGLHTVSG
jgi:hypothetical protein